MTDGWNMTGGKVYVAPVGADPKDPSRWHQLGTLTEMETDYSTERGWHRGEMRQTISSGAECTLKTHGPITLYKPEPTKSLEPILTSVFTFDTKGWDPEVQKLYYGADVAKSAGANNHGEARKEEKHMEAREFRGDRSDSRLRVNSDLAGGTEGGSGVYMKVLDTGFGWFNKADVPLIAHALFEKSGWPDAGKDGGDAYKVTVDGESGISWIVGSEREANKALAGAIANLAAYNEWHEGAAEREAAEAAKKAEAEEASRKKREHDELRTSAIALEALAIYNEVCGTSYASWDATNSGIGCPDEKVREYIAEVEAARAAKPAPLADWERELLEANNIIKPAPKVGDRVRVSVDAKMSAGYDVYFGGEVEGVVTEGVDAEGDIVVEAQTSSYPRGLQQAVDPKYLTILASAEDLAAEKAKAERDAGIAAIQKHIGSRTTAECMYAEGFRFTA